MHEQRTHHYCRCWLKLQIVCLLYSWCPTSSLWWVVVPNTTDWMEVGDYARQRLTNLWCSRRGFGLVGLCLSCGCTVIGGNDTRGLLLSPFDLSPTLPSPISHLLPSSHLTFLSLDLMYLEYLHLLLHPLILLLSLNHLLKTNVITHLRVLNYHYLLMLERSFNLQWKLCQSVITMIVETK